MYTKFDSRGKQGVCLQHVASLGVLAATVLTASTAFAETILTFIDNANPSNPYPSALVLNNNDNLEPFGLTGFLEPPVGRFTEFRMIDPNGKIGGGGHKSVIDGSGIESWTFNNSGVMTATSGFPLNPGAGFPGSVAPIAGTNPSMEQIAPFFGPDFNFLAPTLGSLAGNAYGTGSIIVDVGNETITASFPVLEAQWGGTFFPLGQNNNRGITMSGSISNIAFAAGTMTFDFVLTGEHTIDTSEDPGSAGFSKWNPQWDLPGSTSMSLQAPSSDSGGLAPGAAALGNVFNDGRLTLTELGAGADSAVTVSCVGGCFDFAEVGAGASIQVILPLSAPTPQNAVYRKYDTVTGLWSPFVLDANNRVESVTGALGACPPPGDAAYGGNNLAEGHYCVQLTIEDDGPNDSDAALNNIADPGGVGGSLSVPPPPPPPAVIPPGEKLDSGACSIATVPVSPAERADWWLVGGFLLALGALRRRLTRRQQA